ncbi:MAG: helix-turn-helix domain-containing protein [Acidobacteriaceae bacterium]|jgi:transcriptional regulator with XRE-family HTH domain|nr:helix-turn-helix domain-containing protein [Acidobacteriaceae bacterium]
MAKRKQGPYADLAALIRSFRIAANWTQGELAEKAGIALMSVSAAENGRNARWETLTGIANAFGFENFIELCRAENHPLQTEQTRALLRAWKALPDDQARKDALDLVAAEIVKPRGGLGVSS